MDLGAPGGPAEAVAGEPAKPAAPARDTAPQAAPPRTKEEQGYAISFGAAKIVLAGLNAKEARRQHADRDDGLSYVLSSGNISNAKLVVYGVKNVSVKQRYQSRLALNSPLGSVDLRDLGLYTSGWNTLRSSNANAFSLSGLNDVAFSQVNNSKIKNAADRELRKRKTSSRTIQRWMKELRNVRSAGDKPCEIKLDNVQWQLSGTDANGRPFQKNIRIEV